MRWQNIFHVLVNANSIVQNEIMINASAIVKIVIGAKMIIVGIAAHVFMKIA